jgi:transcriptional regulator with XRE-family HTH domain
MSEQGHWIQGVENPREDLVIDIGSRLRELRKVNDLSQNDLERRSGLPRTYISRVESGHVVPTWATLKRWASALGVGLCELF